MMSYLHAKNHDNWISSFRGVAMTRFLDGRTDGQTDGVTALLDLLLPSATQIKIFFSLVSKKMKFEALPGTVPENQSCCWNGYLNIPFMSFDEQQIYTSNQSTQLQVKPLTCHQYTQCLDQIYVRSWWWRYCYLNPVKQEMLRTIIPHPVTMIFHFKIQ